MRPFFTVPLAVLFTTSAFTATIVKSEPPMGALKEG
jgi:hypothetical protein